MPPRSPTVAQSPWLAAIRLLLDHARHVINPHLASVSGPMNRIVVLALYARSVVLTEAICHLGEGGFGREVLMLNRPLFELMVDAHWAHADLALAEERFVQHARFEQHLRRRVVARYPDVFDEIPPLDELADVEELKQLKGLFGPYGQRSWTALSMHQRIAAIETQFDEASTNRRQLRAQYEIGNAANNAELHPSTWSLARAVRRVPEQGGEMLQFRAEREPELTPAALQQTWWILTQLLGLMHIESALPIDRLSEAADAGVDLVAAAQAAGPRTGPT